MPVDRVMAKVRATADEPPRERRTAVIEHFGKRCLPFDQRSPLTPERIAIGERAPVRLGIALHRLFQVQSPAVSAPTRTTVRQRTVPLRKASKCVGRSAKSIVTTLACTREGRHSFARPAHS